MGRRWLRKEERFPVASAGSGKNQVLVVEGKRGHPLKRRRGTGLGQVQKSTEGDVNEPVKHWTRKAYSLRQRIHGDCWRVCCGRKRREKREPDKAAHKSVVRESSSLFTQRHGCRVRASLPPEESFLSGLGRLKGYEKREEKGGGFLQCGDDEVWGDGSA